MTQVDQALAKLDIKAPSRRAMMFRRVGIVVLILAVVAGGFAYYAMRPTAPVRYDTARIGRGDIVATVTATGEISPRRTVDVGAQISGRVAAVHVDVNDHVHAGDLLVEIDTTLLEAAVGEARANVASAAASLDLARATLTEARATRTRNDALRERDLASASVVETSEAAEARANAEVAGARARLAVARAALDRATIDLDRARILAPIDGVVLTRTVEPGQTVASSFSTPVLFQLAEDLALMELHVDVDEADVGRVREGQHATFVVDAYPTRTFEAAIVRLEYASHIVERVVAYEATLSIDNADLALRPGMTATATIETDRHAGVLTAPNRALRFQPTAAARFGPPRASTAEGPRLFVLENNVPQPLPVTLGGTDGTVTEVSGEGITEGLEVVLGVAADAPVTE